MAATINGKNVIASGSTLLRTGQVARVYSSPPGSPMVEFTIDEVAPYGIVSSVVQGGLGFSVNGMVGQADVMSLGTGTWDNKAFAFEIYAFRAGALGNGGNVYRVDFNLYEV